jgi:hypothetical protein
MLELIGKVAVVESGFLALGVFVSTLFHLRKLSAWRCVASATLLGLAAFLAASIVAISIVLRDGLGPDSVPSYGVTALTRSASGLSALVYALPPALLGWWVAHVPRSSRNQAPKLAG